VPLVAVVDCRALDREGRKGVWVGGFGGINERHQWLEVNQPWHASLVKNVFNIRGGTGNDQRRRVREKERKEVKRRRKQALRITIGPLSPHLSPIALFESDAKNARRKEQRTKTTGKES